VVNFQTVFQEYEELKRLDAEFRAEVETYREAQQAKVSELEAMQQQFNQLREQAAQPEVSEEERGALAEQATKILEELNRSERALREARQSFEQELEAKGIRLRRKIVQEVNQKVAQFAEQQGWDLVLDSSAVGPNGLPVIQYARPDADKTRWLITELNQTFVGAGQEEP
jgi:Skp family chaperone for outer membrane proteins